MKNLTILLFLLFTYSAIAQTACDSVDVVSIKYSPFTDTIIVVHVLNNNQNEIYDYPGFVILDDNGDTVAVETVNYFGIGQESVHSLNVRPGVHNPSNNFNGSLELYSGFYDTFECEWDLDQSLCSDQPCDSVIIGFQNWGGALVAGDFAWTVEDESAALVDSGSFTMTTNNQYWFYGLCLEPGFYTYGLTALTPPSGGGPTLTVSTSTSFASPTMSAPLDWFNDPGAEIEFPFFEFCDQGPNGVETQGTASEIQVLRKGNQVSLSHQELIKTIEIFTVDGKLVLAESPNSSTYYIPEWLESGVFVLRGTTPNNSFREKIVLN